MIDVALIDGDAADHELVARLITRSVRLTADTAVFDDATDTWLLGEGDRARVVIDARRLHSPWIPDDLGRNEFAGVVFHSSKLSAGFDPAGKRIAVVGDRAAHVVPSLAGAEVTLFDSPPTWRTRKFRRWLPEIRGPRAEPRLIAPPVDCITRTGVRTTDGTDHDVDVIIFATGSVVREALCDDALVGTKGLHIQQAWRDSAESYFGIAVHGFPNYFMVNGPDSPLDDPHAEHQLHHIAECLSRMQSKGSTRVEVRHSAQQQFSQRARVTSASKAFDFTHGEAQYEIYDGPATLTVGGTEQTVRVRLRGHLDPIDGKYHWQGTVFAATNELPSRAVELAIDEQAPARITERTPWGSYSIAGVGAPPFDIR